MRYGSDLFLFLPHKSPLWRLCFLVCVRSCLGWTGGCQPAALPRSSSCRVPCGLREVDDVGVKSFGVPG